MRRTLSLFGLILFLLSACAKTPKTPAPIEEAKAQLQQTQPAPEPQPPTWEEQYDLGLRYLSEGNYEEAIIAFTAAIEIDPKRAPAFIERGDSYVELARPETNLTSFESAEKDYRTALELDDQAVEVYIKLSDVYLAIDEPEKAAEILQQGFDITRDENLKECIEELEKKLLVKSLQPALEALEIPFTVDAIILGESGIDTAKAAYADRPYAHSNLMNDETFDTVYTCFGLDMPVPEGYEEKQFGFFFCEPIQGGGIEEIQIHDPSFTCLGELHIGDEGQTALSFFGFPDTAPIGNMNWELRDEASLSYLGQSTESYTFTYEKQEKSVEVMIKKGKIYGICLRMVPQ